MDWWPKEPEIIADRNFWKDGKLCCGVKTKKGKPCRRMALENGRCRYHGGNNTGAPKGNNNATYHGVYKTGLSDEEWDKFPERIKAVGDLVGTILLALNTLDRIATWIQRIESGEIDGFEDSESTMERDGAIIDAGGQVQGGRVKTSRKRKRPSLVSLYELYDRYLGRVQSLQRTWQEMQQDGGSGFGSAEEAAMAIQAALHSIEEKTGNVRIPADGE